MFWAWPFASWLVSTLELVQSVYVAMNFKKIKLCSARGFARGLQETEVVTAPYKLLQGIQFPSVVKAA